MKINAVSVVHTVLPGQFLHFLWQICFNFISLKANLTCKSVQKQTKIITIIHGTEMTYSYSPNLII